MMKLEFLNEIHREMYEEMRNEWNKEPDFLSTSPGALFYGDTFEEFLTITRDVQKGNTDKTPATTFFAIMDDKIIGGINIRHNIEAYNLKQYSGHIGYGIRPSERKKGYATKLLGLGLWEAKKLDIKKVLISHHPENIASEKVILSNGGEYFETIKRGNEVYKKYWITL